MENGAAVDGKLMHLAENEELPLKLPAPQSADAGDIECACLVGHWAYVLTGTCYLMTGI